MKKVLFLPILTLAASILLGSCKKENAAPDAGEGSKPEVTELNLLKSSQWKVLAKQSFIKYEGASGSGHSTIGFSTQKPDELRWYTGYSTQGMISDPMEMILNTGGTVSIHKDLKAPAYGGDIKTFVGTDVWKVNRTQSASYIDVFKNDQIVDLSKYPEGQTKIDRIQFSEDGLLNSTKTNSSNSVSHYSYSTGRWKDNTFWGNNFVTLRYKGRTYAIAFTRLTSANGMTIMKESDDRVVVPDNQIPGLSRVHYPMTTLKSIPGEYGFLMNGSVYGDDVFVIFHSHTSNTRYGVVRVNLSDLTLQSVQVQEQAVPFGLSYTGMLSSTHTYVEVDDAGNLYVVESQHSIRKYNAAGGSELILKEQDLLFGTQIHGIKFFNGKLHVALMNRENLPDGNPNDNSFKLGYHMQIICPK